MPIKHQSESYRTRNGIRYVCDGDIWDSASGDLREQAIARVSELRSEGRMAFYEKHAAGDYYRVFVQAR